MAAVITTAVPDRIIHSRAASRSSSGTRGGPSAEAPSADTPAADTSAADTWADVPACASGRGTTIMAGRSRDLYQAVTASTAAPSGIPGSPSGRAEFARPVKPPAARSSHSPSAARSAACQCSAPAPSTPAPRRGGPIPPAGEAPPPRAPAPPPAPPGRRPASAPPRPVPGRPGPGRDVELRSHLDDHGNDHGPTAVVLVDPPPDGPADQLAELVHVVNIVGGGPGQRLVEARPNGAERGVVDA